ncbi:MAG: sugar ABC transporter permease [Chloroflexi bacterium RBG_16_69_14]|nr:MAG: sugar ABC transporter permease [Chloroflexi bacterium RBG_16_69_14]
MRRVPSIKRGAVFVNVALIFICLIWLIPTVGLLVSSVRAPDDIQDSGWWTVLPHPDQVKVSEIPIPEGLDTNGVMTILGATGTFEEFRAGIKTADGRQVTWVGNKRAGRIEIQESRLTANTNLTLDNYAKVLTGKDYELTSPDGSIQVVHGDDMSGAFVNSLIVAIPSTLIPILVAAFAAYGFAWMRFPLRGVMFILVVAMLVVPLQIALVPILRDYVTLGLNGTYLAVWLAHTGFGLALAIFLLYNYISELPRDLMESAFIDGASHFQVFWRLIMPLSVPALAAFAIFQFLWVWNDYLVALIFIGAKSDTMVVTQRLAEIVGSRGDDWHLLTAGAFISMLLPLFVFFALQRYFVRGLLSGSVKG